MPPTPPLGLEPDIPGLIFGVRFRPDGSTERVTRAEPDDLAFAAERGWVWLHFALADVRCRGWIERVVPLPERARAILLGAEERPALLHEAGVLAGVLADLRRDFDTDPREVGLLRFALAPGWLVSARAHPLRAIDEVRVSIEGGRRLPASLSGIELIAEEFARGVKGLVEALGDELDEIEDRVLDEAPRDERRRLVPIRRIAVRLRRHLGLEKALCRRLLREEDDPLPEDVAETVERILARLDGIDRDVEVVQDRARLLQEEVTAKMADASNRHLYALSVMTALLLPSTLVTGIFGMNTAGLPLTQTPGGSWLAIALVVAASAAAYWILRRLDVLR